MSKPPVVDAPIVDWPNEVGRRIRLPQSRRLVNDLLYFSRDIPAHSVVRECQISEVVAARDALKTECGVRISWPILFTKAFAWVAIRHSPLRSLFMKWPFGHLYMHPYNVSRMTILREFQGEDWVFFFRLIQPENQSLVVLQQQLDEIKTASIEDCRPLRKQMSFSRYPTFLRRLAWWVALNTTGLRRVKRLATFGMTTVSGAGARAITPPIIGSSTLTFGPIDAKGHVSSTLVYDHRVMDGRAVAGYLAELEDNLNGPILAELQSLRSQHAKANIQLASETREPADTNIAQLTPEG